MKSQRFPDKPHLQLRQLKLIDELILIRKVEELNQRQVVIIH